MFEKVNPSHPDKVADRIAGAMVDLAYTRSENPKVAVEVLLGHGYAYIIAESSVSFTHEDVEPIVQRITGKNLIVRLLSVPQDEFLAANQHGTIKCGDNGIFRGECTKREQATLTSLAHTLYKRFPYDGKYVVGWQKLSDEGKEDNPNIYCVTICQSHAKEYQINQCLSEWEQANYEKQDDYPFESCCINPLGPWTGGPDVDCGATNRKLGSDMGDAVTGGGLMGKDLSKADVSVNIVCHLKAVASGQVVTAICSIGDENVTFTYADGRRETERFADIVEQARLYIMTVCGGSFEKFAEWGLIRPLATE